MKTPFFYGQSTHFSVPIHENSHFYGQQKAVSKIGIYFIGFFFAFGFGSVGIVVLMSAVR